jgi:hypothetical protein
MTRKSIHKIQPRATIARRPLWWIVGTILLTVIMGTGYWFWEQNVTLSGPNPSNLTGRWLRPDGGYVLELSNPTPEGLLKAVYFNPRPINVSRAEWKLKDSVVRVLIELRDVNYPGSTYTLGYSPKTDKLTGIYFQAALGQRFEVEFERIR